MTEQDRPDLLAAAKDALHALNYLSPCGVAATVVRSSWCPDYDRYIFDLRAAIETEEQRQATLLDGFARRGKALADSWRRTIKQRQEAQETETRLLAESARDELGLDDTQAIDLCDMAALLDNDAQNGDKHDTANS